MQVLNSSGISHHLENLIRDAKQTLILVSPYLKFHDRIKSLIEFRKDIAIHIIYGKTKLKESEKSWIDSLPNAKLRFCKNLHAKCYMNDDSCIITSMNLYDFSQQENYEIGVLITKSDDREAYKQAAREIELIHKAADKTDEIPVERLPTSKLARKHKLSTDEMLAKLRNAGFIDRPMLSEEDALTEAGQQAGGEHKSGRYGKYFEWPSDLKI